MNELIFFLALLASWRFKLSSIPENHIGSFFAVSSYICSSLLLSKIIS
jgi:hypothetical protein